MYDRTFVKTFSLWYGSKRPAERGRATTMPPAKAARTRSRRAGRPGNQRRFMARHYVTAVPQITALGAGNGSLQLFVAEDDDFGRRLVAQTGHRNAVRFLAAHVRPSRNEGFHGGQVLAGAGFGLEVHGNDDEARTNLVHHVDGLLRVDGLPAAHRHQHHVDRADVRDLLIGQWMTKVAQMRDAHATRLEDENRVEPLLGAALAVVVHVATTHGD